MKMKLNDLLDLLKRANDPDGDHPKLVQNIIRDLILLNVLDLSKIEMDTEVF